jgi:hypothetical protein
MAGETVLFWDGRQYKQTICHHLHSKCQLLPTEPGINAVHQFTQIWNDCLPHECVKVNTKSQPPTLLQMLAPKLPTNPITFLSSMDLQLDDTSTATTDSEDIEHHDVQRRPQRRANRALNAQSLKRATQSGPAKQRDTSQVNKDILAKLNAIKMQVEHKPQPL